MRVVWFQLVDVKGEPLNGTTSQRAYVEDNAIVADLQEAAVRLGRGTYLLHSIGPADLIVFENAVALRDDRPLRVDAEIGTRGTDLPRILIVRVPVSSSKRPRLNALPPTPKWTSEPILSEPEPLVVPLNEYQLDTFEALQESKTPIVYTPELHKFWAPYGGFPPSYIVRKEEVVLSQVVQRELGVDDQRVVIVGSPGVGKSCVLLLIAFYMACVKHQPVLIIRRVKGSSIVNAVVYLDGLGSFAQAVDVSPDDLRRLRKQHRDARVLLDGYPQTQVTAENALEPFALLATSCQYDTKHDEPCQIVMLPAWQRDDLEQYARLTDWVITTGLRNTKTLDEQTWSRLIKEDYFYSGGSLRAFCKPRSKLSAQVEYQCHRIHTLQVYELVYTRGGF